MALETARLLYVPPLGLVQDRVTGVTYTANATDVMPSNILSRGHSLAE
jgi:hypothetical protein